MDLDRDALLKSASIGLVAGLILTMFSFIPCIGIVMYCVVPLAMVGVGATYAIFTEQNGNALSVGPCAIGGILSGLAVSLSSAVIFGLCSALVPLMMGIEALSNPTTEALASAGSAALYVLIAICGVIVVGAVAGAAGGAGYAAIQGSRNSSAPAV